MKVVKQVNVGWWMFRGVVFVQFVQIYKKSFLLKCDTKDKEGNRIKEKVKTKKGSKEALDAAIGKNKLLLNIYLI